MILKDYIKLVSNGILEKAKTYRGDWDENDPASPNYIKNRPFYQEKKIIKFIDNLTSEKYYDNNYVGCTFNVGQPYTVIWNGVTYKDLVCYRDGYYNIIASAENGCPFYIDDDGGDGLYIDSEVDFTVSILGEGNYIKKIDSKYLPDDAYLRYDKYQELTDDERWNVLDSIGAVDYGYVDNAVEGFVRYNRSQSLTESQKTQARRNIGAVNNYDDLLNKPEILQSDWNQNDATSNDYIKNRVCYETYTDNEYALPFRTPTTKDGALYVAHIATDNEPISIISNNNMFYFDSNPDKLFELTIIRDAAPSEQTFKIFALGNSSLINGISTLPGTSTANLPFTAQEKTLFKTTEDNFCILFHTRNNSYFNYSIITTAPNLTLGKLHGRIYEVIKLDPKFIPDTVQTATDQSLLTADKTVSGAINEIYNLIIPLTSEEDAEGLADEIFGTISQGGMD